MAEELDPIQLAYFNGLKNRIIAPPVIRALRESLSQHQDFIDDTQMFKDFLDVVGFPNDLPYLSLELPKSQMIQLFEKIKADKCLAITNCFGFDEQNKFQIIQKGIIVFDRQRPDEPSNEDLVRIYNSEFRINGKREIFKGFDLSHKIEESELAENRAKLRNFYSADQFENTFHGYALPVDAMLQILTDTDKLGGSEILRVSFGLVGFNSGNIPDTLSSFTFYISDIDVETANYFVKCTSKLIPGFAGDCPPKTGCK